MSIQTANKKRIVAELIDSTSDCQRKTDSAKSKRHGFKLKPCLSYTRGSVIPRSSPQNFFRRKSCNEGKSKCDRSHTRSLTFYGGCRRQPADCSRQYHLAFVGYYSLNPQDHLLSCKTSHFTRLARSGLLEGGYHSSCVLLET